MKSLFTADAPMTNAPERSLERELSDSSIADSMTSTHDTFLHSEDRVERTSQSRRVDAQRDQSLALNRLKTAAGHCRDLYSIQRLIAEYIRQELKSDGCAVGKNLESMLDTFVSEGDELMTIGAENRKELKISLRQTDLPAAMLRVNQKLPVRIGTHPRTEGHLVRVNPGATRRLSHPALAATNGGALTVTERPGDNSSEEKTSLQPTEQRFDATIEFSPDVSSEIPCGERGLVTLGIPECSACVYCCRAGRRWLEEHLTALTNAQNSPGLH